jgi:gluconokinase
MPPFHPAGLFCNKPFLGFNRIALSKMTGEQALSLVFMGVAGCGKSSLAQVVAQALRLPLVEGDSFHSDSNRAKMAAGTPLTDADRAGWLEALGHELQRHQRSGGAVLTCSALKLAYRQQLRAASAGLQFVFLDIPYAAALARVQARAGQHFFSDKLVESQFATLERPGSQQAEPDVLRVDAQLPLPELCGQVLRWLPSEQSTTGTSTSEFKP